MIFDRTILELIERKLAGEPKVVVLYGPRQAGKTFLINKIIENSNKKSLFLRGDDVRVQEIFETPIYEKLKSFIGDTELLVIDEAQKIENIGASLKLIFDSKPIHIMVSGSSSFDLANKLAEPMTGRATFFNLYPLSILENLESIKTLNFQDKLNEFLVYGMYPKVLSLPSLKEKEDYLYDLINTYLYNDLLSFKDIKKPKKILDLLSLLALQIGSEVNIQELSNNLKINRETVEKYLDILEKMFIVINIRGFNRNLRKEVTKTSKYYFVDLGLRNAIIRNFNSINLRNDAGASFENLCIIERIKSFANKKEYANWYFWRTYDQKEIDLIEEKDGKLKAIEFKLTKPKSSKAGREFLKTYNNSIFEVVTTENLLEFISS